MCRCSEEPCFISPQERFWIKKLNIKKHRLEKKLVLEFKCSFHRNGWQILTRLYLGKVKSITRVLMWKFCLVSNIIFGITLSIPKKFFCK